ncbi:MAG: polyprenyl synthetase family protein [Flavobacteriales bacterium]|nr:polyprenyl synthetase family protein [Flavobacteriales bacterium]
MATVAEIKAPIANEMARFESHFKEAMKSETPLLDKITHYIIKRKGKQMRPMFVFLSANVCGGVVESTYTAASLIELLHTATLVHDDVVDDAYKRRGFFSVNALWKNKIAVLVGDYLLSRGLLMSVDNGEFDILRIVSNAVREMSEGELLQIEKARKLNINEEVYFEIIRRKTASLIAACCEAGASSAGGDKETQEKLRLFGEYVGIAFQIKDDLFDYGGAEDIGKPTGIDIKERKMTLPLIRALNIAPANERRKVINIVKNHHENPEKVKQVIDYVVSTDGLKYAHDRMMEYTHKALAILEQFPESDSKTSLRELVHYTINRKK